MFNNNWAIKLVEHIFGVSTNVVYFENQLMMTKMTSCSPTIGGCMMKPSDILFQDLVGTSKSLRSPETLTFSTVLLENEAYLGILHCVISHIWLKVPIFH